jgi:hypothetical protein
MAFSADGHHLGVAFNHVIDLWDVDNTDKVWTTSLFCSNLTFSPNSLLIAAYGADELHILSESSGERFTTVALEEPLTRLDFSIDGRQLITDRGALFLGGRADESDESVANALAHLYIRAHWVNYASRDILWLPPDYRPPRCSISGDTLVFVNDHGDISSIQFDASKLADVGPTAPVEPGLYMWKRPRSWESSPTPKPPRTKAAEKWRRLLRRIGIRVSSE